ncbi:MAG: hypothetical protein NDJ89_15685 [Oligoflexia bacterium]|nr:hypothetical protein [Oligoflexia bacterium]
MKKLGTVLFITDDRLSREKAALLARHVHALRQTAELQMIGGGITEEELLKLLETKTPHLVLAPWYRYLAWSRVEAFYGLTRTSGPTFAGYFCEPLQAYEVGEQADHLRAILVDLGSASPAQTATLLKALIVDRRRSGVLPLHPPGTPVYCESWYLGQGLGARMDTVLALPELRNHEWTQRSNALRICLGALWSLIYEEGPGKTEFHQLITQSSPKAYLQVAASAGFLTLRLCYTMPGWSPKTALASFWPERGLPVKPAQLLGAYSDFLRVHWIAETNDLEIVVGFLSSAAPERQPGQARSIWIEPLAAGLVSEVPYETPNPNLPHLRQLPGAAPPLDTRPRAESAENKARERFILDAAVKIRELRKLLDDRETLIRELRSGGIGTAPALPPPDAEGLLEAFQEKFFEARFQIRQFETQIAEMENRGATPGEIEALRKKMLLLAQRQQGWILKLAAALESYRSKTG